jgi:hypothetical protein
MASAARGVPAVTMTLTSPTPGASAASRSYRRSAQRYSIATFCPSMKSSPQPASKRCE